MKFPSQFKERLCNRRAQELLFIVFVQFLLYMYTYRVSWSWRILSEGNFTITHKKDSIMEKWDKSTTEKSGEWITAKSNKSFEDASFVDLWSSNLRDVLVCSIPKLEPFSETVMEYLAKTNTTFYSCEEKYPLLFESSLEGEIVPLKSLEEFGKIGVQSCCYRIFYRPKNNDNFVRTENECYPLSLENSTTIHPSHEFISITCNNENKPTQNTIDIPFALRKGQSKVMDMHAFIHVKPEVEERKTKAEKETLASNRKVNVVIFGLDAVSRMNVLRTMPKTYDFLMKKLKAVDMAGYNKVGDNTFPNIVPMLTSLSSTEIGKTCGKKKVYDDCPFIWKEYAKRGYRTSYAEDSAGISIFNFHRKGFIKPPTDYYMRPFSMAESRISHQVMISQGLCYGPRLGFQVLLDNMKKFVFQMSRLQKPFFQFTWSTSLCHDNSRACKLGDKHLLSSFQWLDESGYLNDTVFILMSDHGSRVGAFRDTLQGQIEDRLPFVLFLVPEWMRTGDYSNAYQNLVENSNKLVTTYDLHQTLVDLLQIGSVKNQPIHNRTNALFQQREKHRPLPKGISLFLPVPKGRTCKMAGIEPIYCSCNYLKIVPNNNSEVVKAALVAVNKINSILKQYDKCAKLTLNSVEMALESGKKSGGFDGYLVNFKTLPGNGMFEAFISRTNKGELEVWGTISRTNLYGNQSHCVYGNVIKLYCYCLDSP